MTAADVERCACGEPAPSAWDRLCDPVQAAAWRVYHSDHRPPEEAPDA